MELAVKWRSLLHEPDAIIEIRSIDPKPTVSGYFRADSPRIAAELAKYPNRTFYQSLNPVKSACYARAMAIICFLRYISAQMTGKWLRIFSLCWTCGSAQTRQKLIRRCITHQELPSCMEQLQRKEPIRRNVRTDRAASSAIRSRFEKHPLRWSRILQRNCIKRRYRQKLGVPAKKALGTLSIFFPHMAWRWRKK